jgi:hypothetical protein
MGEWSSDGEGLSGARGGGCGAGLKHAPLEKRAGGERASGAEGEDLEKHNGGNAGGGTLGGEVVFGNRLAGSKGTGEDEALAAEEADVLLDGEKTLGGSAFEGLGETNGMDVASELGGVEAGGVVGAGGGTVVGEMLFNDRGAEGDGQGAGEKLGGVVGEADGDGETMGKLGDPREVGVGR